ncbi:response regulator [Limisalsivibrio acetivorans]|uniref:response regulator n=1 Tax=Limisalsivibrio acetivorans TaxID=1304888 RepID=UPI0003B7B070|nr:response regulator [Limisalsivibrio acetivorans]
MDNFRILIVEDDIKISKIHSLYAEKVEGFEVAGIANTLEDAGDMYSILEPDLILLDLYFPEGNGLEFLRKVRSGNAQADFILITAAKEMKSLQAALYGGAFDYLIKPVIFDRFQESLIRFREHRRGLASSDTVEQKDVDRYFSITASPPQTETSVPKGVDPLTLKKIKKVFKGSTGEGFSAEAVSEISGVSRSTARRYLEYLISINYLYADQVYGTVGRPERKYFKMK